MSFTNPLAITFIGYLVAMIVIGFIAWRYTENFDDYILGGRSLGSIVSALSYGASDMSGWLLLGVPGAVFLSGISESWIAFGLITGTFFNWRLVAARLRVYTEKCQNALTLPDYFTKRFDDKNHLLAIMSAVVILIFFTIYCASGMVAGARLFEVTFGFDYHTALFFGAFATIAYVFVGGFLAVAWTDAVQATLMCLALIVTPIAVMIDAGGFSAVVTQIDAYEPKMLSIMTGQSVIGIISLLAWGLGYFGQPHILVRFMATKSISVIPRATNTCIMWMIFSMAGAVCVGFFGRAFFLQHPDLAASVLENPERVFMVLSQLLFSPWIAGILMSAILAAVMSTLSCQLLVSSSTLTEDLYHSIIRPKAGSTELLCFGRLMVLGVAAIAIYIAMDPTSVVFSLVSYAWAGFGAAFGPVVLMSLWFKRMTRNGALAGMAVGAVTVLVWHSFGWFGLYELLPGFVFAAIAVYVVSILDKNHNKAVEDGFDDMVRVVTAK
ncbi:MAG TPA: sodium/proline symporter PutP [Sutterella sp.]|nr:sodium/proline symporter PutP [Sutterella sp.]